MAKLMGIKGVATVIGNLKKRKDTTSASIMRGLKKAGLFLQRESMLLVPVDTGNLRASAFTRSRGGQVWVGYTAGYAIYVHENLEAHHPVGQAKFLEQPLREKRKEIIDIIKREAIIR